jgi:hypothetical protein
MPLICSLLLFPMGKKSDRKLRPHLRAPDDTLRIIGMSKPLSRKQAVKCLLDTAIWLWFHERNPVAVHMLARPAYECLCVMLERDCEGSDLMYGWLKHASSDKAETVDFLAVDNTALLFKSGILFLELFNEWSPAMRTFEAWYLIKPPYAFRRDRHYQDRVALGPKPFLPKGVTIEQVIRLERRTFFRRLTKAFEIEDAANVAVSK